MRKPFLALALVLITSLNSLPAGNVFATPSVSGSTIVQTALRYLGYPYTAVGNSPGTGFSCIGFVSYVYQSNGIPLPDDLGGAMAYGPSVSFSNLMPGDVLFFQNTVWYGLSHTAIYLGGGRFVHAEWYNRGVVTSSFTGDPVDGDYWMSKYLGATRPWATAPTVAPPQPAQPAPVAPQRPAQTAPVAPQRPALLQGPRARVSIDGLYVRMRPSLLGRIRRSASLGTTLVVLKQYRSWEWVQLPDRSFGWVMSAGTGTGSVPRRSVPAPTVSRPTQSLPLTRIGVSALRVHVRPNIVAPVIGAVYRGQGLITVKRWAGWLRVVTPSGARGWIRASYAVSGLAHRASGSHATRYALFSSPVHRRLRAAFSAHTRHRLPTVTAGTRLRSRPGLHSLVLTLAAPGTRISVLRIWNGWAYGRFSTGGTGWVSRAFIQG